MKKHKKKCKKNYLNMWCLKNDNKRGREMNPIVKRIVSEIECLDGAELRAVIDALVETFEKRQAARLTVTKQINEQPQLQT